MFYKILIIILAILLVVYGLYLFIKWRKGYGYKGPGIDWSGLPFEFTGFINPKKSSWKTKINLLWASIGLWLAAILLIFLVI